MKYRYLISALILLFVGIIVATTAGVTFVSPLHIWRSMTQTQDPSHAILWQIRLPRIALALIVGAALAVAGALSQSIFANPIAEPAIVGISASSALALLVAVATGLAELGTWNAAAISTGGTILVSLVMVRWAPHSPLAFLLTGIGVAAVANALIGLITSASRSTDLRSISFWSLGSLALATWAGVLTLLPFVFIGIGLSIWIAPALDYFALGNARHLGIEVKKVRSIALIALSFLVATAVALVGVIAFVGLVIPHIVRLLIGPSHRTLLVFSALFGASFVLIADTIARIALSPLELPIGLLTSLIGAPLLLLALRNMRVTR